MAAGNGDMGATARTIQDDEVSLGELHQSWQRAEAVLLRRVAFARLHTVEDPATAWEQEGVQGGAPPSGQGGHQGAAGAWAAGTTC